MSLESEECLICGSTTDLTVEHIIPQTLWNRWGIDPNRDDLAVFTTRLCGLHNSATGALHEREDMMRLIDTGERVSKRTLSHLADWAIWVTLLLGLARGSSVLDAETSRAWLLHRFTHDASTGPGGGPPKGTRVYAARVTLLVKADAPTRKYVLALRGDSRVILDAQQEPCGLSFRAGVINAAESIRVGELVLLVLGPTYSSGQDHTERLDAAAVGVGLERIFPPAVTLPALVPAPIDLDDVSRLFTVLPFGGDLSLLPPRMQALSAFESSD